MVEELEALGLVVLPNVTNTVKLLIAADPDSESGKAQNARKYGILIVGEEWLMRAIEQGIDVG